jgi:hypothetical protein
MSVASLSSSSVDVCYSWLLVVHVAFHVAQLGPVPRVHLLTRDDVGVRVE